MMAQEKRVAAEAGECKMELKILEKTDRIMSFSIDGIDEGFANSLRRIMMNEIPILAVEKVNFEENTSGLFDEIIAHRIGMIPIKFERKMFNFKDNCKCEGKGCSRCEALFILEKQGPSIVTAGDLKAQGETEITENEIPITELLEGQRIKLEAIAQLGIGREHAKWQSAIVGYHQDKRKFTFSLESTCGLTAGEILEACFDIMEEKSADFMKEINKHVK
jgi:DNA-directed RNA polymerase subunit D